MLVLVMKKIWKKMERSVSGKYIHTTHNDVREKQVLTINSADMAI